MIMGTKIMNAYEKNGWRASGELEENLASQVNDSGKAFKPGDLLSQVLKVVEMNSQEDERARILLIALLTLELKPKEKEILLDQLKSCKSYSDIYKNMQKLSGPLLYKMGPKRTTK